MVWTCAEVTCYFQCHTFNIPKCHEKSSAGIHLRGRKRKLFTAWESRKTTSQESLDSAAEEQQLDREVGMGAQSAQIPS